MQSVQERKGIFSGFLTEWVELGVLEMPSGVLAEVLVGLTDSGARDGPPTWLESSGDLTDPCGKNV